MLLSFDRTNFPLIAIERVGVEIQLLPVTKVQFEQFVAESDEIDPGHYQAMLALNPPVEPDQFTLDERERLFITGILPEEIRAFARWLGEGFDLPTVKEWRAVYATLRVTPLPRHDLPADLIVGPAGVILDRLLAQLQSHSMLDVAVMRQGLVEWVRQDKAWVGLGAPRPQFYPNLWDPLSHEIKPIQLDQRLPYFGFRLVRRGKWYLADREKVRYVD